MSIKFKKRYSKMKRLFIFENSNAPHETSIISAIKIFKSLGFHVVLCLNHKSIDRITQLDSLVNIKIVNISKFTGLVSFYKIYKNSDYVLFNTILLRNLFMVVIVSMISKHNIYYMRNINSWFHRPNNDNVNFKNKILGNILFFTKKVLLTKSTLLAVGSYNMQEYLLEKTNKKSFVIPFNIFEKNKIHIQSNDKYTIVIPGTIDLIRKDLNIIAEATYLLNDNELEKLDIILLGRPISEKDKLFVINWKKKIGSSLTYYDKFIKDDEFEKVLKNADIIMGTLNVNYQDKYGNQEIYGKSKDTGIEAHAIAYAKPLFVNEDYSVDKYLESTTLKYIDANDCYLKIRALSNKEIVFDFNDLIRNSENYSLAKLGVNI